MTKKTTVYENVIRQLQAADLMWARPRDPQILSQTTT